MAKKILIIDDNPSHRLIYRTQIEMLMGDGFEVIEAGNTADGFEKIVTESPVCVVLDYMMHGGDGFQLLHKLKIAMPDHPPVIFVSCAMTDSLARNAMALGAAACMEKSTLNRDDLTQVISEVINEKG